jgi:FkbM family methyltransferase
MSYLIVPRILFHLPERLAGALYYHFLRPVPDRYSELYQNCRLRYAPPFRMKLPKNREYMYDNIALLGFYERKLTKRIYDLARNPGGILIDVGANVGYFCLIWQAGRQTNRSFAIEASPVIIPWLQENMSINHLNNRVTVFECAASNEVGRLRFSPGETPTGWGRLASRVTQTGTIDVTARRLDDLVDQQMTITLIKIDVEGAESLVIEGAERLLRSGRVRHVYCEINRPGAAALGLNPDTALDLLRFAGYKLKRFDEGNTANIEDWWASA